MKKDTKLEKSWSELNSKENEIKDLKQELREVYSSLRSKQAEVMELQEKLFKTTEELNLLNLNKENIYREKVGEIRHKDEEIKFLKEVSVTKVNLFYFSKTKISGARSTSEGRYFET